MASKKTNLRSFRYSDEVAAILEQQEGTSLNDKFENLVLTCYYKLPEAQKRLENTLLLQRRESDRLFDLRQRLACFLRAVSRLESAIDAIDDVCGTLADIKDVTQL